MKKSTGAGACKGNLGPCSYNAAWFALFLVDEYLNLLRAVYELGSKFEGLKASLTLIVSNFILMLMVKHSVYSDCPRDSNIRDAVQQVYFDFITFVFHAVLRHDIFSNDT